MGQPRGTMPNRMPAVVLVACLLGIASPATASEHVVYKDLRGPGRYTVASVSNYGEQSRGHSGRACGAIPELGGASSSTGASNDGPSVSDNGRYVAFTSSAPNLHKDDWNAGLLSDVFVRDLKTGVTKLASNVFAGLTPSIQGLLPPATQIACTTWSFGPTISGNGRFVVFASRGISGISPTEDGGLPDFNVYRYDLKRGETVLVSAAHDGSDSNGGSGLSEIGISQDGKKVVFTSDASNLVRDLPPCGETQGDEDRPCPRQAYLWQDGKVHLVSAVETPLGVRSADQLVMNVTISDDGSYVVFDSPANNLVDNDKDVCPGFIVSQGTSNCPDVFRYDVKKKAMELVTMGRDGRKADFGGELQLGDRQAQIVSADGRFIVFKSGSNNLVPAPSGFGTHEGAYVRDMKLGRTDRVSVTSTGQPYQVNSPSISDSGRYVLIGYAASLPSEASPPNGGRGSVMYDRATGQLDAIHLFERPTGTPMGRPADDGFALAGDARSVSFISEDAIVPSDSNAVADVYVKQLDREVTGVGQMFASVSGPATAKSVSRADGLFSGVVPQPYTISEARVVARPELGDLYVKIRMDHLPVLVAGSLPTVPIVVGMEIETESRTYRFRASGPKRLELFRCDETPSCTRVASLKGGYGTTGESIVASIPLELLAVRGIRQLDRATTFQALVQ